MYVYVYGSAEKGWWCSHSTNTQRNVRAISIGKDSAVHLHLKEKETLSRMPVFAFWTEKLDG